MKQLYFNIHLNAHDRASQVLEKLRKKVLILNRSDVLKKQHQHLLEAQKLLNAHLCLNEASFISS